MCGISLQKGRYSMKRITLILGGGGITLLSYFVLAGGDAGRTPSPTGSSYSTVLAVLVGMVLLVLLGLLVVLAFVAGSWWTERQVRLGANIATTAQNVNDRWDERKTASFAALAREMVRLGQSVRPAQDVSSPPLLTAAGSESNWMAPLDGFSVSSDPHNKDHGGDQLTVIE